MIVFRVQDKDGRGPWRPGFAQKWSGSYREDLQNLKPWYIEFGPIHLGLLTWEHSGSGCASLEQLRRWFTPEEYRRLLDLGYKAVCMDADRVLAQSEIQCFFARSRPLNEDVAVVKLYEEAVP